MKKILITGATDGLGKAVAHDLAMQGHTLLLHGRNTDKGKALVSELTGSTGNKDLHYYNADFDSLEETRRLADRIVAEHQTLDVLINNAGIGVEPRRMNSKDGLEMVFQVNYLATYIMTRKLFPALAAGAPSRIVNVSSAGQTRIDFADPLLEKGWERMRAYCQSKLAQIMLGFELADTYAKDRVTINSLHPATYMPTKIVTGPALSTIADGVASVMRLAVGEKVEGVSGKYYDQQREARADPQAYDARARKQLMELSRKLTGVE